MKKAKVVPVLAVLLVLAAYVSVLVRNLNESERRSLQIREQPKSADYVLVSIRILSVGTSTSEMTARIGFRLFGKIGTDEVTPAANLRVLINSVQGPQEFVFPRGERVNPIETTFALDGNVNKYPFDRYESRIRILVTTPGRAEQAPVRLDQGSDQETSPRARELAVVANALRRSALVPAALEFFASLPGIKFQGQVLGSAEEGTHGVALQMTRADQLKFVSIFIMVLMMLLAVGVLSMATKVALSDLKLDMLPLTLSITLTFGLPALRNVQPGVPPVGVFGDYVSFIWAEIIVAFSALVLMVTWLLRPER